MIAPTLVPPFARRLHARIETSDQPLVRIHGWPGSGARRFLRSLVQTRPEQNAFLPSGGRLVDRLRVGRRGGRPWFLLEEEPETADLLEVAADLDDEERLIFASRRRTLDEVLPERSVGPAELRLTAPETTELFAGAAVGRVGELMEWSEGWFGPLEILRRHWPETGGTAAGVAAGEEVRRELRSEIFGPLPESLRTLISICSVVETLEPQLWFLVWSGDAERVRHFTELFFAYGLHVGEPPRLPRLLRDLVQPVDGRAEADLLRRVATAAALLGRWHLAAEIFDRAGDSARRRRILDLANGAEKETLSPAPRGLSARYSLQLLGHPAAHRPGPDGRDVELHWRLRRAFETVAFLALVPDHRASKEELIAAVWPEASDRALAKNFHPTLSEARRTLGGGRTILFRQGRYHLNPEITWEVDVHRFEDLCDQGRGRLASASDQAAEEEVLEIWQAAWRLYRGPLLRDHEGPWLEVERRRLQRQHLVLLGDLGDLAARLERDTLALDAYRSVLLEDPFEERIHLAVMRLYARQGRRDLVRRQYVRLQELLLDELSEEPSAEVREIYHRLMG